ncbi:MAG: DUF881 domain-containing protein [Clostridiaceae bacterium]
MIKFQKITILFGSIVLGVGISILFHITTGEKNIILAQSEYKDATEYKLKLLREIDTLNREKKENAEKLDLYKKKTNSSLDITSNLEEELTQNRMLLGAEIVKGPGITLVFSDGEQNVGESADSIDSWLKTIHNDDMLKVINGLKLNGAEMIEINGERITSTTEIYCSWAFITINGKKLPAPFEIKAIGDQEKLLAYANSDFGQVKIMANRGIKVNVKKAAHLVLKDSIELIAPEYLSEQLETGDR